MYNTILFTACLVFGWLVLYSYGWRKGYKAGRNDEQDANSKRFIHFSIQRFGDRLNYSTRHENN